MPETRQSGHFHHIHDTTNTGVHAIQMELAQASYLTTEQPPFAFDDTKAERLRPHLKRLFEGIETVARQLTSEDGPK